MENETPKFLIFALLAVMLEEATGFEPQNIEYIKFWEQLEEDAKRYIKNMPFEPAR